MIGACFAWLAVGIGVTPIPSAWGLDPWYVQGTRVQGMIVAASAATRQDAVSEAARLVEIMLRPIPRVRKELLRQGIKVAIIAESEVTLDVPENRYLGTEFPDHRWNERTRGVGPNAITLTVSAAEENLLRLPKDRYQGESIFMHEFSHAIMDFGFKFIDPTFMPEIEASLAEARLKGRWAKTYAQTNSQEYWAEGYQSYYGANYVPARPNGVHNGVNSPEALRRHDPRLYRLLFRCLGKPRYNWREDRQRP